MNRLSIIFISALILCGHAAAQTGADYSRLTADNHPRLLFSEDDFTRLKEIVSSGSDELVLKLHEHAMAVAGKDGLDDSHIEFRLDASGKRLLPVCRKSLGRLLPAAYAYKMTGDKKYLRHVVSDLNDVCSFDSWNPRHFLDVAEMATGVAIAYDWLYNDLKPGMRAYVAEALDEYALQASRLKDETWFYGRIGNWNQVCNAGLVTAALAIYECSPELARTVIEDAVRTNRPAIEGIYGPDGAYPEGPTYWDFGTVYQTLMLTLFEDCLGTDFGLSQVPGFLNTGLFKVYARGNVAKQFNFGDNSTGCAPAWPIWWFAARNQNPSLLYHEMETLASDKYRTNVHKGFIPYAIRFAMQLETAEIAEPEGGMYAAQGNVPMMMCRTGWRKNDLYLGIKGGKGGYLHGHMDAGEFVFDAYGVRWAADINRQAYAKVENGIRKLGGKLSDLSQESLRWELMRLNCRYHNTLTVNDRNHDVEYVVPMVAVENTSERMGASFDMTGLFRGDLGRAVRTAAICDGEYLEVRDSLRGGETPARVRWTFVTEASPVVFSDGIVLTKNGVRMLLKTEGTEVEYMIWSADPLDYDSVVRDVDSVVKDTYICGFLLTVPPRSDVTLVTTLKRLD